MTPLYSELDLKNNVKNLKLQCKFCRNEFYRPRNQVLACLRGSHNKLDFCNRECFENFRKSTVTSLNCKACNKLFIKESKSQKFCSQSCSATIGNFGKKRFKTEFVCNTCNKPYLKAKSKNTLTNKCNKCRHKEYNRKKCFKIINKIILINEFSCAICNKKFMHWAKKATCSDKCKSALISRNSKSNPNCGGETNYKKFLYNNVWFDSSWEIKVAKFLDSH